MRLFEIPEQIEIALHNAIDPDTGEINNADALDLLNDLEMQFEEKALNVACYIKNQKAEVDALKAEAKAMTLRAKHAENKANALKMYLQKYVPVGTKFENTKVKISWSKSESTEVTIDDKDLPTEYQRWTCAADKTKIKTDLKNGVEIIGCSLQKNDNIQVK